MVHAEMGSIKRLGMLVQHNIGWYQKRKLGQRAKYQDCCLLHNKLIHDRSECDVATSCIQPAAEVILLNWKIGPICL